MNLIRNQLGTISPSKGLYGALKVMSAIRFRFVLGLMLVLLCLPGVSYGAEPGLAGYSVKTLTLDPGNPHIIYAGITGGRVAKSVNGGADWTIADTEVTTDPITTIAVTPGATNVIYASGYAAGFTIAKSTDGGATWDRPIEDCDDEGYGYCAAGGFYTLTINPKSGVLYAGAKSGQLGYGRSVGIFMSADGGVNWTATTMPGYLKVYLAIDPKTPSTIYAAGWGGGVYKSTNSGGDWTAMNEGLTSLNNNAIVIDPVTPSTIYVGSSNGNIYKSTDSGGSWTPMSNGLGSLYVVQSIAIDPTSPTTLYVGGWEDDLYKTTDGGATWSLSNVGLYDDRYSMINSLVVDPKEPSSVYAATGNGVYKSEDGGATWVHPPPELPPEPPPEMGENSTANYDSSGSSDDPVNTYTGELFKHYSPDINLGGPMSLYFQRYYASYLRRTFVLGDLGSNWRHNFDAKLAWNGEFITYVSYSGRVTKFRQDLSTKVWSQLTNTDTPYQLSVTVGQDVVLYDPDDERIYTFDYTTGNIIAGKLTKIEDGKGNLHMLSYDLATGHLVTVSDGLGRTLTFTYNTDTIPKISIVTDGTRSVNFQYTDPVDTEYLTIVTDVLGGTTTYAYEDTSTNADHALMRSQTFPRGNIPFTQTFYGTDNQFSSGRVASQTDANGNTVRFGYVGSDTTITDPLGKTRIHTHTATGELSGSTDRTGQNVAIGSDVTGRRNSITDRFGDVTRMSYHTASGKLTSKTNADGTSSSISYTSRPVGDNTAYDLTGITHADTNTESFAYDASGNLTGHTDQAGNVSSFTYNSNGQPLTTANSAGGVTTYTYNADATQATHTDSAGNTTSFGYDALKRLNLITFADDRTLQFTYDAKDHQVSSIDENVNTTTFSYDANGNLATITDPLNYTTTFAYDGNDRLLSSTDQLGGIFSITYDALGRPETTTDENSNTTTRGYDTLGRLTTVTLPNGNSSNFTYDAEAVIASASDGLGNTTTFTTDQMGRITQTSSPLGNINRIGYDTMGRIISTTDPLTQTTTFNYDSRGLLSGIDLPGGVISATYTRNNLGNIAQITDPNGNNWKSSFNNQGLVTSRTDPLNNVQKVTYNNRNRPAAITYADGIIQTLGYDPTGNLISSSYSGGGPVFNYSYDANNRLISANNGPATPDNLTQGYNKAGRISNCNGIAISRDAGGRITSMTLAAGKTVTYAYDPNDNLISVTDWTGAATSFSYDATDRLIGITRPAANGIGTSYAYDKDSRLVGVNEDRGATAVSSIALTRDAKGQITQATRNTPQPARAGTPSSITHSFDAASQTATAGFAYDARGRLTDDGTKTYTWNAASRLSSITEGAATTTYTYDSLGQRLSRNRGGVDRSFVWNTALGLNSISIERDAAGNDLRYFIHTPAGALLYSINSASNARQFYHFDEMGNTISVTDDSGAVIGSYAYTPYGKLTASTGALDNLFTWQGKYGAINEGNGLYYMRARYYNSDTGRFISRDPMKSMHPLEVNPYQYAMGNPVMFIDPLGTESHLVALYKNLARTLEAQSKVIMSNLNGGNMIAKAQAGQHLHKMAESFEQQANDIISGKQPAYNVAEAAKRGALQRKMLKIEERIEIREEWIESEIEWANDRLRPGPSLSSLINVIIQIAGKGNPDPYGGDFLAEQLEQEQDLKYIEEKLPGKIEKKRAEIKRLRERLDELKQALEGPKSNREAANEPTLGK